MKFRKKISSIIAVTLVSTMGLSACGTPEPEATETPVATEAAATTAAAPAEPVAAKKIVLFQSKVEITDQLEDMAEEYLAETGVEIEVWGTTGDDYFHQLKSKLASDQGPTVFSTQPGTEAVQISSYLADLSDLSFIDKIQPGFAQEIDGKVIGIPYTVEGFGLVYNKSLIDPTTITDYDTYSKMMQDMQAQGINGVGLSQESYFLIGHILNTPFALQENPTEFIEKLNAGEVKMADTPEFQEFAKFYADIREYSYNPLEVPYDKAVGDFAAGKTAAIHQGNWAYGILKDFEIPFEMGMMPLPVAGNDKIAVSPPTQWSVNSQATPEEIAAGKDFIEWLYTSETGKKYLYDVFNFIPVIEGDVNSNLDPISLSVKEYMDAGNTIPWALTEWPAGIIDVTLLPVAQEFFISDMTPEEFLVKLDEAWATQVKQ